MISPLDAHIGYWMRHLSNHVSHAFERKLESKGVTIAEWVVLRLLFDDCLSPSDLAKRIGMTKGAVSKIVDRLTEKGLVEVEAVLHDRRSQTIRLSSNGLALVPALCELADSNDAEYFGHLSEEHRQALIKQLRDLTEHANLTSIPTK